MIIDKVWTIDASGEPVETTDPSIVDDAYILRADPYVRGPDGRTSWTLGPHTLRSIYVGDGDPTQLAARERGEFDPNETQPLDAR